MGEIRSTLEIILEKTKGITLTDEEKESFKRREIAGKVRGLLQKFMDGTIGLDRLQVEMTLLQEKGAGRVRSVLKEECVNRIGLDGDQEPLLGLLEKILGAEALPLRRAVSEFQENLEGKREKLEQTIRGKLSEKGISGSALMPNVKADPEWECYIRQMGQALKDRVNALLSADRG